MLAVLGQGGLGRGGLNFDAKVRRESFEPTDLFYAHIGAMDAFAQGLKIAAAIRKDGSLKEMVDKRYASWETGVGAQISEGAASFDTLEKYMLEKGDITPNTSARQELFENVLNRFIK
jgi:xylose isomerase